MLLEYLSRVALIEGFEETNIFFCQFFQIVHFYLSFGFTLVDKIADLIKDFGTAITERNHQLSLFEWRSWDKHSFPDILLVDLLGEQILNPFFAGDDEGVVTLDQNFAIHEYLLYL